MLWWCQAHGWVHETQMSDLSAAYPPQSTQTCPLFAAPSQVLFLGQDLPHGNYAALRRAGSLPPSNSGREYYVAIRNYRTWVLTALYAFNFGVELTMNNGEHGRMQQRWGRGGDGGGCTSRSAGHLWCAHLLS